MASPIPSSASNGPTAAGRSFAPLALLWGFAEATLFFIVPDVLLTLAALHSRRRAMIAAGFAVLGAVLGGALMYQWAAQDADRVRDVLIAIPAISPELLERVREQLSEYGLASLFAGAFSGLPYKAYATEAAAASMSALGFLALSVPARGLRFLIIVLAVDWIARRWMRGMARARRIAVALGCWALFYLGFFSVMAS